MQIEFAAAHRNALAVTARVSSSKGDGACVYALNHTAPRALEVAGNTTVVVDGCVLASNSKAADAVYVGGSASIHADVAASSTGHRLITTVRAPARRNARRRPNTPSSSSRAPSPVSQADSTTQLSINNAAVNVFLLGSCGPSKVVTAWNDPNSSLTFTNALLTPDCTVSGTVVSTPKFHVQ